MRCVRVPDIKLFVLYRSSQFSRGCVALIESCGIYYAGFVSSSFYIVTIVGLFFSRERERDIQKYRRKLAQKLSIIMRNIRIVWTGRFILSYVWKPILKTFCKYSTRDITCTSLEWLHYLLLWIFVLSRRYDIDIYVFKCSMNARIDLAAIRIGIVIVANIACRFSISKLKIPRMKFLKYDWIGISLTVLLNTLIGWPIRSKCINM